MVSSVLLVLMPKCPLCFVAWAGALGLGSYAIEATLVPTVALAFFCLAQGLFLFTLRQDLLGAVARVWASLRRGRGGRARLGRVRR